MNLFTKLLIGAVSSCLAGTNDINQPLVQHQSLVEEGSPPSEWLDSATALTSPSSMPHLIVQGAFWQNFVRQILSKIRGPDAQCAQYEGTVCSQCEPDYTIDWYGRCQLIECESGTYQIENTCITPTSDETVAYHDYSNTSWSFGKTNYVTPTCSSFSTEKTSNDKYICLSPACPNPDGQALYAWNGEFYCYSYSGEQYSQSTVVKCSVSNYLLVFQMQGGVFSTACWSTNYLDSNGYHDGGSTHISTYMTQTFSSSATHLDIDCSDTSYGCIIEDGIDI